MVPSVCPQPCFVDSVLATASRPSTGLDELLQCILGKALAVTASDVGGCICIFDYSYQEPTLAAFAVQGEPARLLAHSLKGRKEPLCEVGCLVAQSGKPYLIEDHYNDSVPSPLLVGGRSSLWVPLLEEEEQITGMIHVESSEPRHYGKTDLGHLQGLSAEAVTAIDRQRLQERMAQAGTPMGIVGISAAFLKLERQIKRVAACPKGPVLVLGERGSGKELTARAVHYWSARQDKPFVPVLTSAFAESLFADELFGHERHAFTDAARERLGKFKAADGGTIFFDEVCDMSPVVQSALLRIIERGELPRLGRDLPMRVDVRVIAATNQNPHELIAAGRFRQDLYDRLSVFELRVPPLRERQEEIPLLACHFLKKYCPEMRRASAVDSHGLCHICQSDEPKGCATPQFYEALRAYHWPGNVRELENVIIRLLASVPDEILDVKHLREHLPKIVKSPVLQKVEDWSLDRAIRDHIEQVLRMNNYNRSQAAKALGVPLSTLRSKMKKLGIELN